MNDINDMDSGANASAPSRGGWAFSAGLLVGLATAIGAIALVVAAQRRRRQRGAGVERATGSATQTEAAGDWQAEDRELDEELAQTFPASDPLPASHRVD